MKIYPNRKAAEDAMEMLYDRIQQMFDEFGVREELDDSCSTIYYVCEYYNEHGEVEKLEY